jgi:drug/metabolite transporter (DMT)-like permease
MGLLVWRTEPQAFTLARQHWLTAALLGLTGVFAYNFFFMVGLQHIAAGRGSLVVALNPVVVAVAAWLLLKEPLNGKQWGGVVIALCGCILVLSNGDPRRFLGSNTAADNTAAAIGLGEYLIIGCVLAWTAYTLQCKRVGQQLSPIATNFWACASGCVMLLLATAAENHIQDQVHKVGAQVRLHWWQLSHFSLSAWTCVLYLGVAGSALSYTWYTQGIQKIGATRAAAFINFVPVFGVLLGALMLGERLPTSVYFGGGLILAGVLITNQLRTRAMR